MNVPVGIKKLDEILGGGIPKGNIVLLEGSSGSGKDVLGYHFINYGLKNDEKALYVFVNQTAKELLNEFEFYNLSVQDYFEKGKFVCIDAEGLSVDPKVRTCSINELYTISHCIKGYVGEDGPNHVRTVLNIVSPALMIDNIKTVYKFLFNLIKVIKSANMTVLITIDKDMHSQQDLAAIEELCDGIIILDAQEKEGAVSRKLWIKRMKGMKESAKKQSYWIDEKGFEMV